MVFIGVTGHRFLTEFDRLEAGIDRALACIDQRYPGQPWAVLSSLAEGADCLVTARILAQRPAARLIVPLPLPAEEYARYFSTPEARVEFRRWLARADEVIQVPALPSLESAYWAAGEYVLEHAGVLIALWDGREAQGRGGTGEVVAAARLRGLPLAWVHAGNRRPGTDQPGSLGAEQGMLSCEGLG
jgi:hypothetical protein